MRTISLWIIATLAQAAFFPALASDLTYSARTESWDNPFLAYGYNPKTKLFTGYLAAFRTAPGRTDECKLVFKGNAKRLAIKYLEVTWVYGHENQNDSTGYISNHNNRPLLRLFKTSLGGDCDWILPFKIGPRVSETVDEVAVAMKPSKEGSWIGVYAIGAKRARFHSQPNNASARKVYLIAGDLIYVYHEQRDWYFVQYEKEKRKTIGWIRKADTVQL